MDECTRARFIFEVDPEPLAGGEAKAGPSVRSGEPEDACRASVHFQNACFGNEPFGRGICGAGFGG